MSTTIQTSEYGHPGRGLPARPVRAGDDLQIMTRRVEEVDTPPAVVRVDGARQRLPRIRPVVEPPVDDEAVDPVEVVLPDEEA